MGFYNSPQDLYTARADRFQKDGNRHWAMAKQGQGDFHYGKAKFCYGQATVNRERAEQARITGATFRGRRF